MVPYETDDSAKIMRRKTLAPGQGDRFEPHLGGLPSRGDVNVGGFTRFVALEEETVRTGPEQIRHGQAPRSLAACGAK
jgi:phage terminase large subunit-like protein